MTNAHQTGEEEEHDLLFRASHGSWQVETCEVASITRTRGGPRHSGGADT